MDHAPLDTKYGLPSEVKFCRRCVISNQRPSSAIEFQHTRDSKKVTIRFDEEGVCDACRYAAAKEREVDWERREAELMRRQAMLKPSPMMPRPQGPHQAVFDHMREQRETYQQIQRGETTRGMRRGWFTLAMVLISLGFLLQIAGSWPGMR